jgi:GNAT superfamily N-acetyltransferase
MTDARALLADMLDTWPCVASYRVGPWRMRDGGGGGNRVSSSTAEGPVTAADLGALEAASARMGQTAQVMVRPGEAALDAVLHGAGYAVQDETLLYSAPVGAFPAPPAETAYATWPPLAVQTALWAEAHVGPARMAVMERAAGPKAAILGRASERVSGTGYVAISGETAFLHALTVVPTLRRQGCARHMLWAAAAWAQSAGAIWLALAVTRANEGARALYASQGMQVVGQYHYRRK